MRTFFWTNWRSSSANRGKIKNLTGEINLYFDHSSPDHFCMRLSLYSGKGRKDILRGEDGETSWQTAYHFGLLNHTSAFEGCQV